MLDKMSDTSRLVSRLNAKDLVEVKPNPHDKRLVNILISEKGLRLLEGIDPELTLLDGLLADLTSEESAQLAELLTKVRKSIKTGMRKIRLAQPIETT